MRDYCCQEPAHFVCPSALRQSLLIVWRVSVGERALLKGIIITVSPHHSVHKLEVWMERKAPPSDQRRKLTVYGEVLLPPLFSSRGSFICAAGTLGCHPGPLAGAPCGCLSGNPLKAVLSYYCAQACDLCWPFPEGVLRGRHSPIFSCGPLRTQLRAGPVTSPGGWAGSDSEKSLVSHC